MSDCGPSNLRDRVAGHSEGDQQRSDKRLADGACVRAGAVGMKITLNEIGYILPHRPSLDSLGPYYH